MLSYEFWTHALRRHEEMNRHYRRRQDATRSEWPKNPMGRKGKMASCLFLWPFCEMSWRLSDWRLLHRGGAPLHKCSKFQLCFDLTCFFKLWLDDVRIWWHERCFAIHGAWQEREEGRRISLSPRSLDFAVDKRHTPIVPYSTPLSLRKSNNRPPWWWCQNWVWSAREGEGEARNRQFWNHCVIPGGGRNIRAFRPIGLWDNNYKYSHYEILGD